MGSSTVEVTAEGTLLVCPMQTSYREFGMKRYVDLDPSSIIGMPGSFYDFEGPCLAWLPLLGCMPLGQYRTWYRPSSRIISERIPLYNSHRWQLIQVFQ
jgi:hypothetical protein